MKRGFLAVLLALGLAGCAHQLTLTPVDGQGAGGHGAADYGMGGGGGLKVDLDGKTYTGRWVYAPTGGTVGFGSVYGSAGYASGTFIGSPGGGGGVAHLTSSDGSSLRCQFTYSSWTNKGMGQCQRSDAKVYDLVIG